MPLICGKRIGDLVCVLPEGHQEMHVFGNPETKQGPMQERCLIEVQCVRMAGHSGQHEIKERSDLTLRQLQTQLPWSTHYHHDFRSSPMSHKDFSHALTHIHKAAGKLSAVVDDAEHKGSEFKPEEVDRFVADLVVCALRMSNTCPGRVIDLQRAVEDRIEQKNNIKLQGE